MIINFEDITKELTDNEKVMIGIVKQILLKADSCLLTDEIISILKTKNYYTTPPRIRKMVHCLRASGVLPIIGTSKGYYVSYDQEEIRKQIESLEQRERSIREVSTALKMFLLKNEAVCETPGQDQLQMALF